MLLGVIAAILAVFASQLAPRGAEAALPPSSPLTQTFSGNVIAKIGPNNPAVARPITATVKSRTGIGSSGGFNGDITEVKVVPTSGTPSEGDVKIDTTTSGWSRVVGAKSKFILTTPSNAAAMVYTKGAWRQIKRDTQKDTVVAYFSADGARLQLNISGIANNGTNIAIEISSATSNDPAFGYGQVSALDAAPVVVGTSPAGGTPIGSNATPMFVMSENVTGPLNAFTLTCNPGGAIPFALTGLGTKNIGLDPIADLPEGATCTATVNMASVTDSDAADPPNTGSGTESFTFTVDVRPSVVVAAPTGLQPTDVNAVITFSEPVIVSTQTFTIVCGVTTYPYLLTVNVAKTIATLNPIADLAEDATCTVTVIANKVSDVDAGDPPDGLAQDYIYTFTTDAAPVVNNISMNTQQPIGQVNGPPPTHFELGPNHGSNEPIEIEFSEIVSLGNGAVAVFCGGGLSASVGNLPNVGAVSIPAPQTGWPAGSSCQGTVYAAQVSDSDAIDPPNLLKQNVTFAFGIDAAPVVTSSSVSGNPPTFVVNFSEPVSVFGPELLCGVDVIPVNAVSSNASATWTFDTQAQAAYFLEGRSCTFTVQASDVDDLDVNDPPSQMVSDRVIPVTTDNPPIVSSVVVTPNDASCITAVVGNAPPSSSCCVGATLGNAPVNNGCALTDPTSSTTPTFTVTFNEPVTVATTGAAYGLSCLPAGGTLSGGVGNNMTVATVTATGITAGAECTFTVKAAGVSDSDLADPPDHPLADYPFVFNVDTAPTVTSVAPTGGMTIADGSDTFEVTFSEPAFIDVGGVTFACDDIPVAVTLSQLNSLVWYVNYPSIAAYQGESCRLTVLAAGVHDYDLLDDPDTLTADYGGSYMVDAPPSVTGFTPNSTAVGTQQTFTLAFSESVSLDSGAVGIVCDSTPVVGFSIAPLTAASSFTVSAPGVGWPTGADDCDVTVTNTAVHDTDTYDTPDTMLSTYTNSFSVDDAPAVESVQVVPAAVTLENSDTVEVDQTFRPAFSESVTLDAGWATITCDVGNYSSSATAELIAATSFDYTPAVELPSGANCTLTVVASAVHDEDSADDPDEMAADTVITFVTPVPDDAPTVQSTTPADTAVIGDNSDTTETFEITFSESVTVADGGVTLVCGPGGTSVSVSLSASPSATFTATYGSLVAYQGEECVFTIVATSVTDTDLVDPPDEMASDYTVTVTVDAPPAFSSVPSPVGDQSTTQVFEYTFSEPVDLGLTPVTVVCDSVPVAGVTVTQVTPNDNGAVYPPITGWPAGGSCSVTFSASQVSDTDTADTPDNPVADDTFNFTVDAAPAVSSVQVNNGVTDLSFETNDVIGTDWSFKVTFTENVTLDLGWMTFSCNALTFTYDALAETTPGTTFSVTVVGLEAGSLCDYSIVNTKVHDADMVDAPDTMAASSNANFGTDAAPGFESSSVADNSTDVSLTLASIDLTFSESVTFSSVTLSCNTGGIIATSLTNNGSSVVTVNIDGSLTPLDECELMVNAIDISDDDSIDAPDNPVGDVSINFTVAADPPEFVEYSPLTAEVGSPLILTLTFTKAVIYTGSTVSLSCTVGGDTLTKMTDNSTSVTFISSGNMGGGSEGTCTATFNEADFEDAGGLTAGTGTIVATVEVPVA